MPIRPAPSVPRGTLPPWRSEEAHHGDGEHLPIAPRERGGDVDPRRIPWSEPEAIFIGCAEDRVKFGGSVRTVARMSKERGEWLHMGRVDRAGRIRSAATRSAVRVGSVGAIAAWPVGSISSRPLP